MKKFYALIFAWFVFLPLIGGPVDSLEIVEVVDGFVELTWTGDEERSVESIHTLDNASDGDYLIALVELQPVGWVLVSTDDVAEPVVGYSFNSSFDFDHYQKNSGLQFVLEGHDDNIRKLRKTAKDPNPQWERIKRREQLKSTSPSVAPLIDVEWDQSSGWNASSPEDPAGPGGHVYVGCVAVSMAQAMTVFEYPTRGTGKKTYSHSDYGTLSVNFDNYGDYNWENMRTSTPNDDIADLLYHCAVTVEMDFGADASGARTRTAASAFKKYFSYSSTISNISRVEDDDEWVSILNDELTNDRSVIYSGDADDGEAGHAFNIDGVSSNGYYHLNWGWSGSHNGYYNINNLAPGSNDFTKNQAAIVGIKPIQPMPTDISLSDQKVMEGMPEGTVVGDIIVEDEAADNEYEFIVRGKKNIFGEYAEVDFYEENRKLKTSKSFEYARGEDNEKFINILVTDVYGNSLSKEFYIDILENPDEEDDGGEEDGEEGEEDSEDVSIREVTVGKEVWYNGRTEQIHFESDHTMFRHIKIFDISGRLIQNYSSNQNSINISEIPEGIYILVYQEQQNSESMSFKFIKN